MIINVSSIVGHRALPTGGAYAATKAAQISLTEALRVELRGTGVHACTRAPGRHRDGVRRGAGAGVRGRGGEAVRAAAVRRGSVAEAIVRCAERPRPEVYPYWPSRGIVWLNALAPGLVDWLSARAARKAGRI